MVTQAESPKVLSTHATNSATFGFYWPVTYGILGMLPLLFFMRDCLQ